MRRFVIICLLFTQSLSLLLHAQAPAVFNLQVLLHDAPGNVVPNAPVDLRISILHDNIYGGASYVELHETNSNAVGLITLEVGSGEALLGSMDDIDWGAHPYFLKVEVDLAGNGVFSEYSVNALNSVPYALYAATVGDVFSGDYHDLSDAPSFLGWDQNVADDFDGYYDNLIGAPQSISAFTNDMGFLAATDAWDWDQNAANDFQGNFNDLTNIPAGLLDGDDDTQLTEAQVKVYITNDPINLAASSAVNGKWINVWSSLKNVPADWLDGDAVLSESAVDAYVGNNGYLTAEVDVSVSNELQNLAEVLDEGNDAGGQRIMHAGDPTEETSLATKEYVDSLRSRLENILAILEQEYLVDMGTFVDDRDDQSYRWVRINGTVWMAENLHWLPEVYPPEDTSTYNERYYVYGYTGSSVAEAKATEYYSSYGVLYNYVAAETACPDGWHLAGSEWDDLAQYAFNVYGGGGLGDETWYDIGNNLKSTQGWLNDENGTDDFEFTALPGGSMKEYGVFAFLGEYGFFWRQTGGGLPQYHTITDNLSWAFTNGRKGYAVRCVKDEL